MNTITYSMNQLPAFQQPQLQILVPQVVPMQVSGSLPSYMPMPNVISTQQKISFWDVASNSVVSYLSTVPQPLIINNQYVAPEGYSFVLMNVPQEHATVSVSECSEAQIEDSGSRSVSVGSVRSEQFISRPPATVSRQATPEPVNTKRKYKHRSKQERILQVHAEMEDKFTALGLYAAEKEVLRGFDTVRVHVKTYRGLNVIEQPLDMILDDPTVQIRRIATPFSMKNKFQKKGFIVYLKLASSTQVPRVQEIFKQFEEYFPKCDIALTKEDKERLDKQKEEEAKRAEAQRFDEPKFLSQVGFDDSLDSWDDYNLCMSPPAMMKSSSLSSCAA